MAATTVNKICRICYQSLLKNTRHTEILPIYLGEIKKRNISKLIGYHSAEKIGKYYNPKSCILFSIPPDKKLSTSSVGVEKELKDVWEQLEVTLDKDKLLSSNQKETYLNIAEQLLKVRLDESHLTYLEKITKGVQPSELYSLGSRIFSLHNKVGEEAAVVAFPLFKLAASSGHKDSRYTYGQILIRGTGGILPDPEQAAKLFIELAKEGHAYSQFALAGMYFTGYGIEQSFEKSYTLYQIAAENGIVQSYNSIGKMYLNGQGVDKNEKKSVEYFLQGAEAGDPQAYMSLGHCYSNGKGVEQDFDQSFNYHKKAADAGYPAGIYNVGTHYFMGKGVTFDISKAVEYFQKASDLGFSLADINLGNMYFQGVGVEKNLQKAKELYQRAAVKHKNAQLLLEEVEKEEQRQAEESNKK